MGRLREKMVSVLAVVFLTFHLPPAIAQQGNVIRKDQVILLIKDANTAMPAPASVNVFELQTERQDDHRSQQEKFEASTAREFVLQAVEGVRAASPIKAGAFAEASIQSIEIIPAAADATNEALQAIDIPSAESMLIRGNPDDIEKVKAQVQGNPNIEVIPSRERVLLIPQNSGLAATIDSWAMKKIRAEEARSKLKVDGKGIKVAVIDSGLTMSSFFNASNVVHEARLNLSQVAGPPTDDSVGHGTHVAGLIGGQNGVGVAPGCTLIPIKVFHNNRAPDGAILLAIDKAKREGVDVVNMSFGGPWLFDNGFKDDSSKKVYEIAIKRLREAKIRVVAAAGNHDTARNFFQGEQRTGDVTLPGLLDDVICVAATDQNDRPAVFSRPTLVGKHEARNPDIAAPGVDIVSAGTAGVRAVMSGTSQATPIVSGLVALMCQQQPSISQSEVLAKLKKSAVLKNATDNVRLGSGRIDCVEALGGAGETPPEGHSGVTAEEHRRNVELLTKIRDYWRSRNSGVTVKDPVKNPDEDVVKKPGESLTPLESELKQVREILLYHAYRAAIEDADALSEKLEKAKSELAAMTVPAETDMARLLERKDAALNIISDATAMPDAVNAARADLLAANAAMKQLEIYEEANDKAEKLRAELEKAESHKEKLLEMLPK